jgi:PIN domain nuclease of toxin-antitoxin system
MRILLDTHAAIWAASDSSRLPARIATLVAASDTEIHVSAASIWEISIKHSLGKRHRMPFSGREAIDIFQAVGFALLDITALHAASVGELSLTHADPFDRLILAQAAVEPMRLITSDSKLAGYSDSIITW